MRHLVGFIILDICIDPHPYICREIDETNFISEAVYTCYTCFPMKLYNHDKYRTSILKLLQQNQLIWQNKAGTEPTLAHLYAAHRGNLLHKHTKHSAVLYVIVCNRIGQLFPVCRWHLILSLIGLNYNYFLPVHLFIRALWLSLAFSV